MTKKTSRRRERRRGRERRGKDQPQIKALFQYGDQEAGCWTASPAAAAAVPAKLWLNPSDSLRQQRRKQRQQEEKKKIL